MFQSASSGLAMYDMSLYIFCLTMHYVEYHVLMAPRCFDTPLDAQQPTDRLFGRLRRNRILFYAVIVLVAGIANFDDHLHDGNLRHPRLDYRGRRRHGSCWRSSTGLFVTHYFVEAFIWKFSNPFYRQSLTPLYFTPRSKQPIKAMPQGTA